MADYNSAYTGPQIDSAIGKALAMPEFKGEVTNFAALPVAGNAGDTYLVLNATGIWPFNRKPAGFYRDDGASWVHMGWDIASLQTDSNWVMRDNLDNTKMMQFQLSGISTGQTRTVTIPDKDFTISATQKYMDFSIPAGAWAPDATNGAEATSVEGLDALAFDAATEEAVYVTFQLPENYNGGVLRWRVDWDAAATASGTAVFGLSGTVLDDSDALSTAFGVERTITDTLLTVGDRHKSPNDGTGITLAGTPTGGDLVKLKLVVKTAGTIAVDVLVLNVQLQYETQVTEPAVWS